jgi:hypothetical protein
VGEWGLDTSGLEYKIGCGLFWTVCFGHDNESKVDVTGREINQASEHHLTSQEGLCSV